MSENQEAKNGVSPQEAKKDPNKDHEEETCETQPQEEQEEQQEEESEEPIRPQKMIVLQRELKTLVTNVQTAADAKESMRRAELEEARRIRLERLENDVRSSQEKFEEITRGWSLAKEKVIPQELQEALNSQQQLCAAMIGDKKKLINELQQELKAQDDRFVKDLRRQEEELDLMMERMENQIQTLTKAYREELAQIESIYQQENEVLLLRDKSEWEQHLKELWDKELERLADRYKKVEEYEEIIQKRTTDNFTDYGTKHKASVEPLQVLQRDKQQADGTICLAKLKQNKEEQERMQRCIHLANVKSRLLSLQTELKNLQAQHRGVQKEFTKKNSCLTKESKRSTEQYERIQKKLKHFAVADARRFEQMWLTVDAEVKQLVETVLNIDSQISRELGLAWQRPPMPFMELSGPVQPQKQGGSPASQTSSQRSQRRTDTESPEVEMNKEGPSEEEVKRDTMEEVMELLCDEMGFLLEDKLQNLGSRGQTFSKLKILLSTFNIEEEDHPGLAEFLLKNARQQREHAEDACVDSDQVETHQTSEPINPNQILPVLKSYLEQHMQSRESSASPAPQFRVTSEDKAYWESMGNIISEDRLKLWDTAENKLKQHLSVLTEISELLPETQSLQQQNAELRMLLQGILKSGVGTEPEKP